MFSSVITQDLSHPITFKTIQERLVHHISIDAGHDRLPIEITLIGKFPAHAGKLFVESALKQQAAHPKFIDEFNEPSALIGKTNFLQDDPTAIYTFGVDTRDLVFHCHAGHRVITAVTGDKGCCLKFSVCTPEEAEESPQKFLDKMHIVNIPGNCMFNLRFNGTIYHQFCPRDHAENAFFAVSIHTNEAGGLSGPLLEKVLLNEGSIPLLTEPASAQVMELLSQTDMYQYAEVYDLDL